MRPERSAAAARGWSADLIRGRVGVRARVRARVRVRVRVRVGVGLRVGVRARVSRPTEAMVTLRAGDAASTRR